MIIDGSPLKLETIQNYLKDPTPVELALGAMERVAQCRSFLDQKTADSNGPIYGVNTGFGSLYKVAIEADQLQTLQENLVMSHACGAGEYVNAEVIRLMMLFKIQALSHGLSGVQVATIQLLITLLNADVLPVIYSQGSLGASGDLAPLAHLSLPLIGKGKVWVDGEIKDSSSVLESIGLKPVQLKSKEGLALLNGTQFMSAQLTYALLQGLHLDFMADVTAALSLEAFDGRPEPFHEALHRIRPHYGQIKTAARVREFTEGSQLLHASKTHVQDPYAFRCVPQVHGATKQILKHVWDQVEVEINAVTDNPTVFPEEDLVLSGGNFHGQILAVTADYLAIGLAELASISERRVYQLISGARGLPDFLVANSGVNSGFMIPQYTAASIVSQNKQYCTPASIDSIPSSNGQEDHVSMGANATTKLLKVVENSYRVLAIEWFTAAQAIELRGADRTSEFLKGLLGLYREQVPFLERDCEMAPLIWESEDFLRNLDVEWNELNLQLKNT
jgi:histidine ammonia-lyase